MPQSILFDFNGVIADDERLHCDALIATLDTLGFPLDRDTYYRDYLGFDDRACFRHAFERMGRRVDDRSIEAVIAAKGARYEAAMSASMALVPGAIDFVRRAHADGIRLAIVSGALRREIELVLAHTGLTPCFSAIVAAEDVPACKPDPAGFCLGLVRLAADPRHTVVIEDSLPGLKAARAAGLRCAMLTTSHPVSELTGADLIWDNLSGRTPSELPWATA